MTLHYTLDQSGSVSQILGASSGRESAMFLYGHSGERLAGFSGRDSVCYATDARNTVRGTTDARGRPTSARSYDTWGTPVRGLGFDFASDERGEREPDKDPGRSSLTQLFGFDGERQDPGTGLVNLRARWYQPASGRMLGRDPFNGYATQPLTQHPYVYAQDNPLRYADPSGRSAVTLLNGSSTSYSISGDVLYRDPTVRVGNRVHLSTDARTQYLGQSHAGFIRPAWLPDAATQMATVPRLARSDIEWFDRCLRLQGGTPGRCPRYRTTR